MSEQWRSVSVRPGSKAIYEVSNLGRVRSKRKGQWFILKMIAASPNSTKPYPEYNIAGHTVTAHRLVAQAFLPPQPSPDHIILHRDGDVTNPREDNLRWGTRSENAVEYLRHQGRTKSLSEEDVLSIRKLHRRHGYSFKQLAELFAVSTITIRNVIKYRTWRHLP